MKRGQAIKTLLEMDEQALYVVANGMISREAFHLRDRDRNFYMIGSMGLAAPIGLGLAMSMPAKTVVVLDGDGNILSNLGALAMAGNLRPANFVHVALDNEAYETTGGQRSIAANVSLARLAAAAGYAAVIEASTSAQLRGAIASPLFHQGPTFIHAKVEVGRIAGARRVDIPPEQITARFKRAARTTVENEITVVEETDCPKVIIPNAA